jgi:NSS family neurotransmitter:Na+ symporter
MSAVGLGFGLFFLASSGLNWLGTIDGFVNGTRGIALLGLLECVAIGWLWRVGTLRRHANSRSDWQLGKWWDYMIRLVIPVALGTLFFWQLFDDIHSESGFFITAQGQWNLSNCVGVGVLVLAPVVSLALTLVKGRQDAELLHRQEQDLQMRGKSLGLLSFLLAAVAGALFVIVLVAGSADSASRVASNWVVWVLAAGGIGGMVLGNYVLDTHNTAHSQASWFARWGGIIATMDVSAFIAVVLFRLARRLATEQAVEEVVSPIRDKLSGVSYAILAAIFLIIIGGLGWCFYKALAAAGSAADPQSSDEVGDESGQQSPQ